MKTKIMALACAGFLIGCSKSPNENQINITDPSKLHPVAGAFGFNIGDFGQKHEFEPLENYAPFTEYSVETTKDGRICDINAMGDAPSYDVETVKERIISVLTEKYGIRNKFSWTGSSGNPTCDYYFGTLDRTVHLEVMPTDDKSIFTIDYYDKTLKETHDSEQNAQNKIDEENKKASLSNGL